MSFDFTVERNSKKYVLGENGFLKEYIDDAPAIEFNPDGSYKGVLVEPQSTNFALDSEDWTTGNWGSRESSATITTDQIIAPDGLTSANKWTGNGTKDFISVDQNHTFDSAGLWTISVFAKKSNNCNWLRLIAGNLAGATNAVCWFDLDTGQVGTGNGTIEDYGDGWYRCSIHPTIDIGDLSGTIFLYAAPDDNDNSWSTSTTGIELYGWGLQIEKSPIATSYIPTTTAAVTRVKDDIYLTSASSLIGQTEGTLFVEVDWQTASDGTIDQQLLTVNNNTVNNEIQIININGSLIRARVRAGNNIIYNTNPSSTTLSGIQKFALAYKTNDFAFYRNGSNVDSSTSGSLASLATLTDIDFGQNISGFDNANMWIRTVALFTSRLTDTECEDLTTI